MMNGRELNGEIGSAGKGRNGDGVVADVVKRRVPTHARFTPNFS